MIYIATYFRGNPQSRNGGYNTTRAIEAKTLIKSIFYPKVDFLFLLKSRIIFIKIGIKYLTQGINYDKINN